ncbi:MAG: polysaccharide biosynthesis C-terminal domain-containing protein [Hyphomicrobiales bacterium]|nr:polysaccharide biosynthesis C-terminal domain-containing protein [Hyphomicrobiales bacterium]
MVAANQVVRIALVALAGHGIAVVLSILLARHIAVNEFEAYVVAASAFIVMVAIAPLGIDKYAVRLLPALAVRSDFAGVSGFLRFGVRRVLMSAVTTAVIVGVIVWFAPRVSPATRAALLASCASLPAGALAYYGVGVLTAFGREVKAMAVLRLIVPSISLAVVWLLIILPFETSGAMAIAAWGIAWIVALAVLVVEMRRVLPGTSRLAEPHEDAAVWSAGASSFLVYRGSGAMLGQVSIILLDALHSSASAVGAYGASLAITAPAILAVTATNRAYARPLSIILETKDVKALQELRKGRLRWLIPTIAAFLTLAMIVAPSLMGLFGPAYVEEGVMPLRILAVAAALTMTLSLAPTYVKYTRDRRVALTVVAIAAALQLVLLLVLVPSFGAAGAALAYAASIVTMYGIYTVIAWRDLSRLRQRGQ